MMSGWLFLGFTTFVCAGLFLNGFLLVRRGMNPWRERRVFGMTIKGADLSSDQIRWMGRLFMVGAPIFWLIAAAISFGLFGPVEGLDPIQFN